MTCTGCHAENEPRRRYCGRCGHALLQWCSTCAFENRVSDRFCGGCGGKLAEPAQSLAPMRVAAVPAPAPAEVNASPGMMTPLQVRELLVALPSERPKLSSKVTQAELDQLFGSGG